MTIRDTFFTIIRSGYDRGHDPKWLANARFLILLMLDSPADKKQLLKSYTTGVMIAFNPDNYSRLIDAMELFETSLAATIAEGYVVEENGLYRLTRKGSEKAAQMESSIIKTTDRFSSGLPASFVSILVNAMLALVSLSVGLLSNSMGLISSGMDDLVSVFTSAAAFLGIKYDMEAIANMLIVVIIAIMGLFLGYESVCRLLRPEAFDSGILPLSVALFNGAVCIGLALYQRFWGTRTGKFSLIILSIDNFNSIYVTIAVIVGIIFARFGVYIVDPLVSLGVALITLKSAFDLGRETIKVSNGAEPDISQYEFRGDKHMKELRNERFRFWSMILLKEPKTREELEDRFSLKNAKGLQYFATRLRIDLDYSKHCESILAELQAKGLIIETNGKYMRTPDGEKWLSEVIAGSPVKVPAIMP
ncbi:MAG TPA: cation transporter [Methanocella sp.]|uniref:cation diffusion facilitator family transporter n=1 Tax=Methanocella sp. TaxID=2052833 RepID=UPI002BD065C7|nr:cation transporter [Methanocella sp.]HTY89632.1 cation transporter [Methanocella sp.]